eukprot:3703638-Pyramimonas_sp.AAC.1
MIVLLRGPHDPSQRSVARDGAASGPLGFHHFRGPTVSQWCPPAGLQGRLLLTARASQIHDDLNVAV